MLRLFISLSISCLTLQAAAVPFRLRPPPPMPNLRGASFLSSAPTPAPTMPSLGFHSARFHRHHQKSSLDDEFDAYFQANNDNFNFWSSEWASERTEVIQLAMLDGIDPVKKKQQKAAKANPQASKSNSSGVQDLRQANATAKIAMLNRFHEIAQGHVDRLNAQEAKSKTQFLDQQNKSKARQAVLDARFKNGTLLAQFHTKDSNEESKRLGQWQKMRDRHLKQLEVAREVETGMLENSQILLSAFQEIKTNRDKSLPAAQETVHKFIHNSFATVTKMRDALEMDLP